MANKILNTKNNISIKDKLAINEFYSLDNSMNLKLSKNLEISCNDFFFQTEVFSKWNELKFEDGAVESQNYIEGLLSHKGSASLTDGILKTLLKNLDPGTYLINLLINITKDTGIYTNKTTVGSSENIPMSLLIEIDESSIISIKYKSVSAIEHVINEANNEANDILFINDGKLYGSLYFRSASSSTIFDFNQSFAKGWKKWLSITKITKLI